MQSAVVFDIQKFSINDGPKNVQEIDIEPYHPLGIAKAKRLGMTEIFSAEFVAEDVWRKWVGFISRRTQVPVMKI